MKIKTKTKNSPRDKEILNDLFLTMYFNILFEIEY